MSTSFNEFLVKLYVKRTQFDLFDLRNAFRTTQNTNDGERYKNGNGAKCPAVFKFDFDVFILNYITYNTRCFAMQLDSMK